MHNVDRYTRVLVKNLCTLIANIILFSLKTGSLVRPKVVKSVHFCPVTGAFLSREYRDITTFVGLPTGSVYPTRV
jgi:hypothetical protein